MSNEWEISRATGRCAVTGEPFAEGEWYYVALFDRPEGFERVDYSVAHWTGPPEGAFCCWKGRVPTRERKPATIAIDSALLVNLFCRLEDDPSEMKQKFRFVLALLLMRKRLLKLDHSSRQDDREMWQMRLVNEQSTHQVVNPQLSGQEVDRLSAQLSAILSGDIEAIASIEEGEEAGPASIDAEPPSPPAADAPEAGVP